MPAVGSAECEMLMLPMGSAKRPGDDVWIKLGTDIRGAACEDVEDDFCLARALGDNAPL